MLSKHFFFVIDNLDLIGSTSLDFAQNTISDFGNTVLNSEWHYLRQMQQKQKYFSLKY